MVVKQRILKFSTEPNLTYALENLNNVSTYY